MGKNAGDGVNTELSFFSAHSKRNCSSHKHFTSPPQITSNNIVGNVPNNLLMPAFSSSQLTLNRPSWDLFHGTGHETFSCSLLPASALAKIESNKFYSGKKRFSIRTQSVTDHIPSFQNSLHRRLNSTHKTSSSPECRAGVSQTATQPM